MSLPLTQFSLLSSPGSARKLLGRPELPIDLETARRELAGRRVLVTGAGGSVGSHLSEMLLGLEPARLTLLDHHDHSLFTLKRRVEAASSAVDWGLVLADVRDVERMARVLDAVRPEVIFHLAAYKHVPFGEEFPQETFSVNVLGTSGLLRLATERGVERFVYPSSDKAVNPPSLYGATKRICEVLVRRASRAHQARYVVARYVNILGTRGSVVEKWSEQIAANGPLTVTDPQMSRYWISMAEATWMLVQAASFGQPGSVLMADAREEVTTVEMALRVDEVLGGGTGQRSIEFTGVRPGERLHEELLSANESFAPGPCPGLLEVRHSREGESIALLPDRLARLTRLVEQADESALKRAVMEAAQALQ